jgi:hypothetical protein
MGHLILFTNKTHYFLLQYGSVEYMKIKRTHLFFITKLLDIMSNT